MLGPADFFRLAAPLSLPPTEPCSTGLLAYVGLGPGQEFIPQFVALLSFAATAMLAILQWPITVLLSRWAAARTRRQNAIKPAESEE